MDDMDPMSIILLFAVVVIPVAAWMGLALVIMLASRFFGRKVGFGDANFWVFMATGGVGLLVLIFSK